MGWYGPATGWYSATTGWYGVTTEWYNPQWRDRRRMTADPDAELDAFSEEFEANRWIKGR